MKFILNKDTLKIENEDRINAGAVNYYEADVEYDESWDGLTIECVIVKKNNDVGSSIGIINKKMFIDQNLNGLYSIGFVGYTIEDNKKIYQISTNLKTLHFYKGAGEIKTENADLPTPTEWEVYIAQIQEMLKDVSVDGGLVDDVLVDGISVVSNKIADIQLKQAVINILIEYGLIQLGDLTEEQIKALKEMECNINGNGELSVTYNETMLDLDFQIENGNLIIDNNINATFSINENGELEVLY